jgi:hypothetical protein
MWPFPSKLPPEPVNGKPIPFNPDNIEDALL